MPLSVSLVICMFCRLKPRGRVSSLNVPKIVTASKTITPAAIAIFAMPVLAAGAATLELDRPAATPPDPGVAAAVPDSLAIFTRRPELVSRFSRFKSARKSAALW